MARQARLASESGIHHVMVRGINRQSIFFDDEDRERFLQCMAAVRAASGCSILAYCLMSNHVHLVLRVGREDVGQTMKRLGVRYVSWFNRKHGRVGHLFQDRFKSRPVDDDEYLITLLRYVWSNPVEAGLVETPDQYRWSSICSLGRSDHVVDERELLALVPLDTLQQLAVQPPPQDWVPKLAAGHRPLHTDMDASAALSGLCQAFHAGTVDELSPANRDRVIRELVELGLSTRRVASLVGVGRTTVNRIANDEAEWLRPAPPEEPTL